MAFIIKDVEISELYEDSSVKKKTVCPVTIKISDEQDDLFVQVKEIESCINEKQVEFKIYKYSDCARYGKQAMLISNNEKGFIIHFDSIHNLNVFMKIVEDFISGNKKSVFTQRTDESSASSYFQFYGYLSQQQNMLQDYIRTSTYQKAIISNVLDFKDKIVLDVGAGSGILSFFATQAGAKKVYAVEASSMAKHAENLVKFNKLNDKIIVVPGKIEEINLPEQVDVIISEPMGYMLFNERMLETYLHAKKFLKPNGKMFPTRGELHFAPFSDFALYLEQIGKSTFWSHQNFHGVDLTTLKEAAKKEYLRQPIVDTFDVNICVAKSHCHTVDFLTANESDLHDIIIPFNFTINQNGDVHGLAFWFEVGFLGSEKSVWLSTNPTQPLTHWYQIRCLLETPLLLFKDQILTGHVRLISNKRQSYDVEIEVVGPNGKKSTNSLDLKNPIFRYTGQPVQPPTGSFEQSPSQQLWSTIDQQQELAAQSQVVTMNSLPDNVMNCVVNGNVIDDVNNTLIMQPLSSPQQMNYINNADHQNSILVENNLLSPNSSSKNSKIYSNGTTNNVQPSSIGGGISPSVFHPVLNTSNFPVSNNLMIGDYATPGNLIMPGQNSVVYK